ncbi:MAG: UvrABC system protein [Bacteroidota bacterium]
MSRTSETRETPDHIRNILRTLPEEPGVYQYYDAGGKILYVGKAKDLRKRVSSYFRKNIEHGKTRILVQQIADIRYLVVESEMDALLLENSLIKKYQPRYNILLKDDKTFPSIVIKKEPFPRIFSTRQRINDGSEYHGPYTSVKVMHSVLELVKKLFPIRTCSLNLNERNIRAGKFKVCLEYHLGNCKGPCEGKQGLEEYEENVASIRKIISGNYAETLRELRARMKNAAESFEFEKAHEIKTRVELLESFQARSTIVTPKIHNTDVFSIVSDRIAGYVNYMKINNGIVVQGYTAELRKRMDESDQELLEHAVVMLRERFASSSDSILLPVPIGLDLKGVEIIVPQKGDKRKLVDLSLRNATHYMIDAHKQQEFTDPERNTKRILETVQADLRLKELPEHIECFDNSNFQGSYAVGACVVFKNGKPSKKDYRIFNIETVEGPDDFASMRETVFRRYRRLLDEGLGLPQLVIIDGGKGQLSAALESMDNLGLRGKIAMIGIAKKLEEIYFPGDSLPVYIDKKSESLKLIQHLRNEAHRFGITRHRQKRSKGSLQTELTQIPGIGEKVAQNLLFHFKTVPKIRLATEEEISAVIGPAKARAVSAWYKSKKA